MSDLGVRQLDSNFSEALDLLKKLKTEFFTRDCQTDPRTNRCREHKQVSPCVIHRLDNFLSFFPETAD